MQFKIEVEQKVDGRWIAEVLDIPGVMVYGLRLLQAFWPKPNRTSRSFEEGVQDQQDIYRSPISVKELHEFWSGDRNTARPMTE